MNISICKMDLLDYLVKQLCIFFPDNNDKTKDSIKRHLDLILQRTEYCFSKVNNKYFCKGKETNFDHLHGDQYAMFLYFAANTMYRCNEDLTICTKLFQLNRILHGIDAYFEVKLPDIFLFVHPLGTVLGRGTYSNYFLVYQQCNIGSNGGLYPKLGKYVSMHPGSSILGNCLVEENCKIAAGSLLMDRDLKENSVYIGNPRSFITKESRDYSPIWK